MTKRILFEKDLEGLTMEDLERLRNHIYARHGYNFNVNEGLDYLPNLYQRLQSLFPDNAVNIKESELHTYSRKLECHEEQLIMVLEASEQVCPTSPQRVPIELLTEEERNTFREKLENCDFNSVKNHFYHFSFKIGSFDRNGVYGHEGVHYYDYKKSSWYKPTTNKLEEVYSKMSEIEKYNIDLIKAYEEKL